ncbi:MAG TPA: hypothetical protein VK469_18890, partial [Candidatus Kapabacteria bacterium]|nr:hypothetical protein [Candidatus Kapabacteria bacterium]
KKTFLNYLTEYLEEGGMPAVVLAEKGLKKEIILNYFNTLIRRDIIEKFKIRNEEVLKDLLKLLMISTAFSPLPKHLIFSIKILLIYILPPKRPILRKFCAVNGHNPLGTG